MSNVVNLESQDATISKLMALVASVRKGEVIGLSVIKITTDLQVQNETLLEPKKLSCVRVA